MNITKFILPVLLVLGGCTTSPIEREPALDVVSVTSKLTIQLEKSSLTTAQRAEIENFLLRRGSPYALKVKVLSHTKAGQKQSSKIEDIVTGFGVAVANVKSEYVAKTGSGDVLLLVESFRAKVPNCTQQKFSNTFINSFKSHPSFGCANSTALAQMVANPKDLIVGEQLGPTNGAKSVATIDSYVAPVTASTTQDSIQSVTTDTAGAN